MFFQLRFARSLGGTLVPQKVQKSTSNPFEIRILHYLFFERVLNSILVQFLVARHMKNSAFTREKQWFSRNPHSSTKVQNVLISGSFGELKTMKTHHKFVHANVIAIFREFTWNVQISTLLWAPKYAPKSPKNQFWVLLATKWHRFGAARSNLHGFWAPGARFFIDLG